MGNDVQMITQCPVTHQFSSSVLVSIWVYHRIVWKNSFTCQNNIPKLKSQELLLVTMHMRNTGHLVEHSTSAAS